MPTSAEVRDQLRKAAADKEDLLSLRLLDLDEDLPEHQGQVVRCLVAFRLKPSNITEAGCSAMVQAARETMGLLLALCALLPGGEK